MKPLLLIPFTLILAGCQSTQSELIKTKIQVIVPNQSMYECPTVKSYPNSDKLTDIQVARLIVQLYKNNQTCKNSIEAVQKFLETSKGSLEN